MVPVQKRTSTSLAPFFDTKSPENHHGKYRFSYWSFSTEQHTRLVSRAELWIPQLWARFCQFLGSPFTGLHLSFSIEKVFSDFPGISSPDFREIWIYIVWYLWPLGSHKQLPTFSWNKYNIIVWQQIISRQNSGPICIFSHSCLHWTYNMSCTWHSWT